jgi:hypothetical protein
VGLQVEQKQEAADTLVAVGKGVILDDKIKQMGGAPLGCWVKQLPVKGLMKIAQDAVQGRVALPPEQRWPDRFAAGVL